MYKAKDDDAPPPQGGKQKKQSQVHMFSPPSLSSLTSIVPFRSVPFRSVPFRSVPFRSVPFRSVPFRSVPFVRLFVHVARPVSDDVARCSQHANERRCGCALSLSRCVSQHSTN